VAQRRGLIILVVMMIVPDETARTSLPAAIRAGRPFEVRLRDRQPMIAAGCKRCY